MLCLALLPSFRAVSRKSAEQVPLVFSAMWLARLGRLLIARAERRRRAARRGVTCGSALLQLQAAERKVALRLAKRARIPSSRRRAEKSSCFSEGGVAHGPGATRSSCTTMVGAARDPRTSPDGARRERVGEKKEKAPGSWPLIPLDLLYLTLVPHQFGLACVSLRNKPARWESQ